MSLATETYRQERVAHWDTLAQASDGAQGLGGYYRERLKRILRLLVAPGQRVLELGCAQGELLAAVEPAEGVGVDFSAEMIERARRKHPNLRFVQTDVHELKLEETFDVIILSDLVNDLWDVQTVLERVHEHCTPRTRIILNFFSRLWEMPFNFGRRMKLARPLLRQNWLAVNDVENLLRLSGFEMIRHWEEILLPLRLPGLNALFNRFLVRLWPLRHLALTHFVVARPSSVGATLVSPSFRDEERARQVSPLQVSVIIPARNEAGNIPELFQRTPEMGSGTELIFVEGHSRDNTYETIKSAIAANPDRKAKLLQQSGAGKGDAVRLGFSQASGEILMILDADMTVPPEMLPRFYDAIVSERAEFVNGVRLVYPMEKESMRFLNFVGNKFFGLAFSWLLGQPIRDTLCGTKVLRKHDYELIAKNRSYFGDFDPFGDFDLLFGAAKLNLKIVDLPVRYQPRTYGQTNIDRFKHGWLLLRMTAFAARRLKFV